MERMRKRAISLVLAVALLAVLIPGLATKANAAEATGYHAASGISLEVDSSYCNKCGKFFPCFQVEITSVSLSGKNIEIQANLTTRDHSGHLGGTDTVTITYKHFSCTNRCESTMSVSPDGWNLQSSSSGGYGTVGIKVIRKAGHSYTGSYTSDHNGKHSNTCSLCGLVTENCTMSAANCTTPSTCAHCNYVSGTVDANNHDWGKWTSNGDNTHTRTCKRTGCHASESDSCAVGSSGKAATCTEAAICGTCETAFGAIHADAHDYASWENDGTQHWQVCSRDASHTSQPEVCAVGTDGTAATCTEAAICGTCGKSFGEPLKHDLSVAEDTAASVPTMVQKCSRGDHQATAVIALKDDAFDYTGSPVEGAKIQYSDNWIGEKNFTVVYTPNNVDAGNVLAGFTSGTGMGFTINKIAPTADMFTFTPPADTVYDGAPKTVAVHPEVSIQGMGQITIRTDPVSGNVGEYTVTIDVTEGKNYLAAQDLEVGTYSITKATPNLGTVTAELPDDTLDMADVTITRTNTTVRGQLRIDDDQHLVLGENTVSYTFVPEDETNYKKVTGTVTVTATDTLNPVIDGVEDGAEYYTTQTVTVTDANLKSVTVNGTPVTGTITLAGNADQEYTIVATDDAGNTATVTVQMRTISQLTDAMRGLDETNVNSDNWEALAQIVDAAGEGLEDPGITPEEKAALEQASADAQALIEVIKTAWGAVDTDAINNTMDINAQNAKPSQKAELKQAKEKLEKALADYSANYTQEEKDLVSAEIARIEAALKAIAKAEQKAKEDAEKEESGVPNTGDSADLILWSGMAMFGLLSAAALVFQKKLSRK